MKKILFACFSLVILGTSCKKEGDSGTGGSATKFMTFTAGSEWNYKVQDYTNSTSNTYTLTSTNRDSSVNGKSYHVFTNKDQSGATSSEYYNITGSEYYQFTDLIPQIDPIELLYLNDSKNVGGSWTQNIQIPIPNSPVPGLSLSTTLYNIVQEKGSTLTVNGITYKDVIAVKTDIQIAPLPIPGISLTTTSDIYNYYSPKYGLIRRVFKLKVTNGAQVVIDTNTETTLQSATIL
jgi:hypothetical protein